MIDKSLAADVLSAALEKGGEFAELFIENTVQNQIVMVNGAVEKAVSGVDYGCGIRIISQKSAIYAYTTDCSRDNLQRVAREASQAASRADGRGGVTVLPFAERSPEIIHHIKIIGADKIIARDMLRLASESAFAFSPSVTQTSGRFADSAQDVLICNSEGLWISDRRVRTRISGSAVASSANEKQTGSFSPGAHMGSEFLDGLDIVSLARKAALTAVTMLNADLCPAGKMPVVIENDFGGVIFHEACGHSLEATSVAKGASVFAGRLGERIASEAVTAVDDGTLPNYWGSLHIDDEGSPTRRSVLIENGILKAYMTDKLNGIRMGAASTGSSRRESYRFAPTSRMTNTYIDNGASDPEDIIRATEYGLYAKEMGGGSVSPATGEFNFAVSEGYLIRNGKIAEPVRGATLIGKGNEVLLNIDMVGNNLKLAAGMCGSLSGSVPTCVGQPRLRVSEILVGGRK
ncbi:MAG: TldD/PmbA family protein [Defluviitaleaceae bacterium]|nr:TldD/PmbA family protein [Defluviitaleaceae bacterium]